jgi:hypothetical protein
MAVWLILHCKLIATLLACAAPPGKKIMLENLFLRTWSIAAPDIHWRKIFGQLQSLWRANVRAGDFIGFFN